MKDEIVKIGSRGSKLALWQANFFKTILEEKGIKSEITIISTKGDRIQDIGFDKLEGKGFFTKEIEDALLEESIDIAIHSMKDLPTSQPEGLVIGGISERVNPCDVLIIKKTSNDQSNPLKIKSGGTIGTSSIRRKVLLQSFQKDITFKDIRGNVPTRIAKLEADDELDAIILAAAGIERLEIKLDNFKVIELNPQEFPSAPAQGVLAYQCRENDLIHRRLLKGINSDSTLSTIKVERMILKLMDGGCQVPLGAYCHKDAAHNYHVSAAYQPTPNDKVIYAKASQSTTSGLAEVIVNQLKSNA